MSEVIDLDIRKRERAEHIEECFQHHVSGEDVNAYDDCKKCKRKKDCASLAQERIERAKEELF